MCILCWKSKQTTFVSVISHACSFFFIAIETVMVTTMMPMNTPVHLGKHVRGSAAQLGDFRSSQNCEICIDASMVAITRYWELLF